MWEKKEHRSLSFCRLRGYNASTLFARIQWTVFALAGDKVMNLWSNYVFSDRNLNVHLAKPVNWLSA